MNTAPPPASRLYKLLFRFFQVTKRKQGGVCWTNVKDCLLSSQLSEPQVLQIWEHAAGFEPIFGTEKITEHQFELMLRLVFLKQTQPDIEPSIPSLHNYLQEHGDTEFPEIQYPAGFR